MAGDGIDETDDLVPALTVRHTSPRHDVLIMREVQGQSTPDWIDCPEEVIVLKRNIVSAAAVLFCLIAILSGLALSQGRDFKAPEIILPVDIINLILNEVSGQQAYNNEAMMAGYNRIRTAEEFDGYFYEADYLAKKLREYGIDEVKIESLDKGVNPGQTWWAGLDAELWMVQPEKHLLSRLAEVPALIARGSDAVDCEGEVVYVDRRDVRKQKDMNLSGKIILTPESSGWFAEAFEKGALGVISFQNYVRPLEDPDQVVFDMRLEKGKTKNKVFGFQISQRLGYQLRDMIFQEQKVVLHVTTKKTAEFPWKADTVFAVVKGNDPAKKGLMFTAHPFERPAKIGANDNVSGSVVLAEVARTLNKLIKEGKLERPERSVYFLGRKRAGDDGLFPQVSPK